MTLLAELLSYVLDRHRPRPTAGQRVGGLLVGLVAVIIFDSGFLDSRPDAADRTVVEQVTPAADAAPRPVTGRELPLVPAVTTTVAPAPAGPSTAPATGAPTTVAPDLRDVVVGFALAQVGRPYERGTAGPDTYDCSGLVLAAYRVVGIELPHWSVAQAEAGREVDWHHEPIEPGDLVFTRGDTPVVDLGHVGIALDGRSWVSAPRPGGQVHVVPIPHDAIQRVRRLVP